jgi:hypothetical protein
LNLIFIIREPLEFTMEYHDRLVNEIFILNFIYFLSCNENCIKINL